MNGVEMGCFEIFAAVCCFSTFPFLAMWDFLRCDAKLTRRLILRYHRHLRLIVLKMSSTSHLISRKWRVCWLALFVLQPKRRHALLQPRCFCCCCLFSFFFLVVVLLTFARRRRRSRSFCFVCVFLQLHSPPHQPPKQTKRTLFLTAVVRFCVLVRFALCRERQERVMAVTK